jgi:hypothetical protein
LATSTLSIRTSITICSITVKGVENVYIHPFLAGILATIITEIAVLFAMAVVAAFRRTKK